jgi:hypothetical protein
MLAEQEAGSSAAVIRAHSAGHPWPAGDPLTQTTIFSPCQGAEADEVW